MTASNFALAEFLWDDSGFSNGNHTLRVRISQIENEVDTTNNELTLAERPITIIPELPSLLILLLFLIGALTAVIVHKRKRAPTFLSYLLSKI